MEINVATESNKRKVSGFFARDEKSGIICLMHDGAVGGGRSGIGRSGFLASSFRRPMPVCEGDRGNRHGILIAPLIKGKVGRGVARFIREVDAFKREPRNGNNVRASERSYEMYRREFSGVKRGLRAREFEYISRHGDVVDKLRDRILGRRGVRGRQVENDAFRDLFVTGAGGRMTELYEVKTSADRQTLYAAIGQLTVHRDGASQNLYRFLIIPRGEQVGDDILKALKREKIHILRFSIVDDCVKIAG